MSSITSLMKSLPTDEFAQCNLFHQMNRLMILHKRSQGRISEAVNDGLMPHLVKTLTLHPNDGRSVMKLLHSEIAKLLDYIFVAEVAREAAKQAGVEVAIMSMLKVDCHLLELRRALPLAVETDETWPSRLLVWLNNPPLARARVHDHIGYLQFTVSNLFLTIYHIDVFVSSLYRGLIHHARPGDRPWRH